MLQGRHAYQNFEGFIIRALVFFAVVLDCLGAAEILLASGCDHGCGADAEGASLRGPGVIIYVLLATFVYVDWIMSLESHWYRPCFPSSSSLDRYSERTPLPS